MLKAVAAILVKPGKKELAQIITNPLYIKMERGVVSLSVLFEQAQQAACHPLTILQKLSPPLKPQELLPQDIAQIILVHFLQSLGLNRDTLHSFKYINEGILAILNYLHQGNSPDQAIAALNDIHSQLYQETCQALYSRGSYILSAKTWPHRFPEHEALLSTTILPALAQQNKQNYTIASIGCSTGEEILDCCELIAKSPLATKSIQIVGYDLNPHNLAQATLKVKNIPPNIKFSTQLCILGNPLDRLHLQESFYDLVLFRNVAMYLDTTTKAAIRFNTQFLLTTPDFSAQEFQRFF